ncbi:hypothetical protein SCOR_11960 [Sulfidibacter corallicola]
MVRRAKWLGLLLLVVAIPTALVGLRILPVDGPAYGLYWLHDHLYLPIKGHTFTRFFPWSLVWWSAIAVGLFASLIAFVTRASLLGEPRILLARLLVRRTPGHGWLVRLSRWQARRGFEPEWLAAFAVLEWRLELARLRDRFDAPTDDDAVERVVALALLADRLDGLCDGHPPRRLRALQRLVETRVVLLERSLTIAPTGVDADFGSPPISEARRASLTRALCERIQPWLARNRSDKEIVPGFAPASLAHDVQDLLALEDPEVLAGLPNLDRLTVPEAREWLVVDLADAVVERQDRLLQLRAHLARAWLEPEESTHVLEMQGLLPVDLDPETLAILSEIAVDVAFWLAFQARVPGMAMAYLEAIESLDFARAAAPESLLSDTDRPLLAAMVADLPRDAHFRLAARLATWRADEVQALWRDSGLADADGLQDLDFELSRAFADDLAAAVPIAAEPGEGGHQ